MPSAPSIPQGAFAQSILRHDDYYDGDEKDNEDDHNDDDDDDDDDEAGMMKNKYIVPESIMKKSVIV